jgi:hypothetical protein
VFQNPQFSRQPVRFIPKNTTLATMHCTVCNKRQKVNNKKILLI